MQRITIVGHLNTFSGYGNHTCETVRGFQKLGYSVSLRAISISRALGSKIPIEIQSSVVGKVQPEEWEILIASTKTAPTPGKKTIFYTMHESTEMDPLRVAAINKAEHVVVPCEWNKDVFVQNGVTRPISVIPMGFDPKVFHEAPIGDLKRVVFGCAGRTKHGRERKGLDLIIKAFREAFPTSKDVELRVKVFKDDQLPEISDPRIKVSREYFTPQQIEEWLHSINVFVNVGSEAFGFWPLQALACGRPVMAPRYGGVVDLNPPDMGLAFEETDAGDFFKGKWCSVKKETLISEMRCHFAHRNLIKEAARQCRSRVEKLTWDNSIQTLASLYEDLNAGKIMTGNPIQDRRAGTCIVQLGRNGDILSILPVAKAMFERDGIRPGFMVQKDYAELLEGVSYVIPEMFSGSFSDLKGAGALASQKYSKVIVPQIYGREFLKTRDSYNVEAWGSAGYMSLWNRLPLEIDRRDPDREKALVEKHVKDKPVILWNGVGTSSPFAEHEKFLEDLVHRWSHRYDFIDLSQIKAERFYDFLGLYDVAKLLITIDTATLHLAYASKVPYCALISDRNTLWHGTRPRGNCVLAMRYSESSERREDIHALIDSLQPATEPRFWHVSIDHAPNDETSQRNHRAASTWELMYSESNQWRPIPALYSQLPRLFRDGKRELPYIKDAIEFVTRFAKPTDYIIFTNSDISFLPHKTKGLFEDLSKARCGFANRRDISFPKSPTSIDQSPLLCEGIDLFAFQVSWWLENRNEVPDMVIGSESWDRVFRDLIRETCPEAVHWNSLIYHEKHKSYWIENGPNIPSRVHNRSLANQFYSKHPSAYEGAFLINLDKRKDRLKQATEECERVGIKFDRMPGFVSKKGIGKLNASKTGCRLSHRECILQAKERGYWAVLILEDDILFVEDFKERWRNIQVQLESIYWDVFLLGLEHFSPPIRVSDSIAKATSFSLTHSYIIHSRIYDKCIEMMSNGETPNDLSLSRKCATYQFIGLFAYPVIAIQRESFSDNDNRVRRWEIRDGICTDPDYKLYGPK